MAELNTDSLKSILHHLLRQNRVDEATQNDLHSQVDALDVEPVEEAAPGVAVPDGFEEVPDAPGTFRPKVVS